MSLRRSKKQQVKNKSNGSNEVLKSSTAQKRGKPKPTSSDANDVAKRPRLDLCNVDQLPDGVILTLGQGDMGQLGLGDEILSRKKPAIVKELADVNIKKIVSGALHTVCLTDGNEIYSFGCNDEYALGRNTDDESDPEYFPRVTATTSLSGHKIAHLTAGDSHTMALTSEGKVFLWGVFRDSHGKMGLFNEDEVVKTPSLIPSLDDAVVSIASGGDHIVLVTLFGKVYSMGCCEQGQLGRVARYFTDRKNRRHGSTENGSSLSDESAEETLLRPLQVSIPKLGRASRNQSITAAFAGTYTSWVLTDDDQVFAWGLNNWNQLGFPDNENRYRPEHCPSLSGLKLERIVGGQHHSIVLDKTGRIYAMGRGEYGRLGLGEHIKQADKAMRIDSLEHIRSISACSCVSFAVDSKGSAYAWGLGSNLQLSTGDEEDEWSPIEMCGRNLEARRVLDVAAGGQHTVMLARNEEMET